MRSLLLFACLSLTASLSAGVRDLRFSSAHLDEEVLVIGNFGTQAEDLAGFRLCSHNSSSSLRYSSGFPTHVLQPGETLAVHLANDANEPGEINASTIGGNYASMQADDFAVTLFHATPFSSPDNMADHLQWSLNGVGNATAATRSAQAVTAGLWSAADAWIATTAQSNEVVLIRNLPALQNAPGDYQLLPSSTLPLAYWQRQQFGLADLLDPAKEAALWGTTADPDGDGLENLLEYALGSDPQNEASQRQATVSSHADGGSSVLQLDFEESEMLEGYTLFAQRSTTLDTWLTGFGELEELVVTDSLPADGLRPRRVRSARALDGDFLRLAVEANQPEVGDVATLSTIAHNVSGTATLIDNKRVRMENFHFDGAGLVVELWLSPDDTFDTYYAISPDLVGTVYSGETLEFSLPDGVLLSDFDWISVWCVPASASFGHGQFVAP